MAHFNRITQNNSELKDVLLGFLESASSLCDMMNTTMVAVLNEIMSIQADEACGAEYGSREAGRSTAATDIAAASLTPRSAHWI